MKGSKVNSSYDLHQGRGQLKCMEQHGTCKIQGTNAMKG